MRVVESDSTDLLREVESDESEPRNTRQIESESAESERRNARDFESDESEPTQTREEYE